MMHVLIFEECLNFFFFNSDAVSVCNFFGFIPCLKIFLNASTNEEPVFALNAINRAYLDKISIQVSE